jgi:uncharacterized protein YjbI with pentapeptide repeats
VLFRRGQALSRRALVTWLAGYKEAAIQAAWSIVNANGGGKMKSLEYLAENHVDLKGLYGVGGYFAGIKTLKGFDLSGANLANANFEGAQLDMVTLQRSRLSGANFEKASLLQADLHKSDLENSNFEGAQLNDVNLQGSRLFGANFKNAHLAKADLRGANLTNVNFERAQLNDVNLQGSELSGVNFKDASLAHANLQYSRLYLSSSNFENVDIDGADFRGVAISDAAGYRALAAARNQQTAKFDETIRRRFQCLANGSAAPDCGINFDVPTDSAGQPTVQSVVLRIECELRDMVRDDLGDKDVTSFHRLFLLDGDYDVEVSLSLEVKGGLAPSVTFMTPLSAAVVANAKLSAARNHNFTENIHLSVRRIYADWKTHANPHDCPNVDQSLSSFLGLKDFVALAALSPNLSDLSGKGVFGGSIQFFKGLATLGSISEVYTDKITAAFAKGPNAGKRMNLGAAPNPINPYGYQFLQQLLTGLINSQLDIPNGGVR